ncbi:MAG: hypothetical protein E7416_01040, partial [Ruminococcaceae bacterium]|nr:hypothetical protein [Oscillospiraceae bacterium]
MRKLTSLLVAFIMIINCAPIISSAATMDGFKPYEAEGVRTLGTNDYAKAGSMIMFTVPEVPTGYSLKYFNNNVVIEGDDIKPGIIEGTVALRIKPGQNRFTARIFDNKNRRVSASSPVTIFGYTYKSNGLNRTFSNGFEKSFEHRKTFEDIKISTFENDITAYKNAVASNSVTPEIYEKYEYAKKIFEYDETTDTYGRNPYYTNAKLAGASSYSDINRRPVDYPINKMAEISLGVFLTQVPTTALHLPGWQMLDGTTVQVKISSSNFYIGKGGVLYIHQAPTDIVLKPHQWYDIKVYIDNTNDIVDCYINDVLVAKNMAVPYWLGRDGFDTIRVYPPYANSDSLDKADDARGHIIFTRPVISVSIYLSADEEYIPGEDAPLPDDDEDNVPPPSGDYVSRFPFDHEFTVKDGLLVVEAEDLAIVNPSDKLY